MPIRYRCFPSQDFTLVVGDGELTLDDWRSHVERIASDNEYPTRSQLTDLRTVTSYALHKEDVVELASLFLARLRVLPEQLAMVTGPRNPYGPTPADMFQELLSNHRTPNSSMLFEDLDSACAWLGLARESMEASLDRVRTEVREGGDPPS